MSREIGGDRGSIEEEGLGCTALSSGSGPLPRGISRPRRWVSSRDCQMLSIFTDGGCNNADQVSGILSPKSSVLPCEQQKKWLGGYSRHNSTRQ